MSKKKLFLIFMTLLFSLPFLSVISASFIGQVLGCQVDEARAHQCLLLGNDIGGVLSSMFVMGWFILITMLPLLVCLVIWGFILIRYIITKIKKLANRERSGQDNRD